MVPISNLIKLSSDSNLFQGFVAAPVRCICILLCLLLSCSYIVVFPFCWICILLYLLFALFAFCLNYSMLYLHFVSFLFCWINILLHLHLVVFAVCRFCILSNLHFLVFFLHLACFHVVKFVFCLGTKFFVVKIHLQRVQKQSMTLFDFLFLKSFFFLENYCFSLWWIGLFKSATFLFSSYDDSISKRNNQTVKQTDFRNHNTSERLNKDCIVKWKKVIST